MKFPIPNGPKPGNKIASFFNALFTDMRHFRFINKMESAAAKMNLTEKILLVISGAVLIVSGFMLLIQVHGSFLVEIPSFGGSFTEGLVGSPRFVNPVLAISDTDKDLTTLVYSGLLKPSDAGGPELDLAESYEISEDLTSYRFKIKEDAYFHDGERVTADDVIFTVAKLLDPVIKSPKRAAWEGVLVEKISDAEVVFTLSKPYAPFLQALTIGILPKHHWENVSSEEFPFSKFNIDPVGSGPYEVVKISRNSGGIPTSMTLSSWNRYSPERPKIKNIVFKFFQNEDDLLEAYNDKAISSAAGLSPMIAKNLEGNQKVVAKSSLPRVFGAFFNQNVAPVFLNQEVREVLDMTAPKKRIVDEVLFGYGTVLNGPTPANIETDRQKASGMSIEQAKEILLEAGWSENENGILEKKTKSGTDLLSFSISTSDAPELKRTAEILQETWSQLGAAVEIKIFEAGDLSQNIIKTRKYDVLLFGEVIGEDGDLYPFWHSSERNDPGLNISLYANIAVDKNLSDLQVETDEAARKEKKEEIFAEIKEDVPAVFLFSPYFLYAPDPGVKNISLKNISPQNERFASIGKWFIETDKVLSFFTNS